MPPRECPTQPSGLPSLANVLHDGILISRACECARIYRKTPGRDRSFPRHWLDFRIPLYGQGKSLLRKNRLRKTRSKSRRRSRLVRHVGELVRWDGSGCSLSGPSSGHDAGQAFNFAPNNLRDQALPHRTQNLVIEHQPRTPRLANFVLASFQ
jgi:hypothetical protein